MKIDFEKIDNDFLMGNLKKIIEVVYRYGDDFDYSSNLEDTIIYQDYDEGELYSYDCNSYFNITIDYSGSLNIYTVTPSGYKVDLIENKNIKECIEYLKKDCGHSDEDDIEFIKRSLEKKDFINAAEAYEFYKTLSK